jgi:small-conductance mechanosensitive channel
LLPPNFVPVDIDRMRAARPDFLKAALFGVVALAAMVWRSGYEGKVFAGAFTSDDGLQLAATALVLLAGVLAVRSLARGVTVALRSHENDPRGGPVGFIVSAIGYLAILFTVVNLLGGDLGGLLLGGALTGVVVGIAAQQTLGNFFAGIVLLIVRPFSVGDELVLRSGTLGGEYEGVVTEMSMFYVHLQTLQGPVALPNAGVLAAAVGPGARSPDEQKDEGEEDERDQADAADRDRKKFEDPDPGPTQGGPPSP